MNRSERSGRKHGALDAFLASGFDEGVEVGEIAKLFFIDRGLCADGQRRADLRNDHTDFAGGNLHPRKLPHFVEENRLPAQAGHEQVSLVAGFAFERDGVVLGELFMRNALENEAHFGGANATNGTNDISNNDDNSDSDPGDAGNSGHHACLLCGHMMLRRTLVVN